MSKELNFLSTLKLFNLLEFETISFICICCTFYIFFPHFNFNKRPCFGIEIGLLVLICESLDVNFSEIIDTLKYS